MDELIFVSSISTDHGANGMHTFEFDENCGALNTGLVLLVLVLLLLCCCGCCGRKKSPKRHRNSHPRSPKDAAAAAAFIQQLRSDVELTQRRVATARCVASGCCDSKRARRLAGAPCPAPRVAVIMRQSPAHTSLFLSNVWTCATRALGCSRRTRQIAE